MSPRRLNILSIFKNGTSEAVFLLEIGEELVRGMRQEGKNVPLCSSQKVNLLFGNASGTVPPARCHFLGPSAARSPKEGTGCPLP